MDRADGNLTATAKLVQYTEITPENIDSFHLHGSPADYPITAVIALPEDDKSAALLRGRYIAAGDQGAAQQILVPATSSRVCSRTSSASRACSTPSSWWSAARPCSR
jgi:hypothetical protein